MDQGTAEWHAWRRQGIGASESAALLGVCPYKTPRQLYAEKLGGEAEDTEASAGLFQRGHETEAMVRAAYEFETGLEFRPAVFEHPVYPFIRASLDGWNAETKQGIEIKFMGKDKFAGPVPEHHVIQVQHQMLVTGVDSWTYLRHNDGQTKREDFKADPAMQARIVEACLEFWDRVGRKDPPPYTDRDWVPDDRPELGYALSALLAANGTKAKAAAREAVLGLVQHRRTIYKGVKISADPARITFPKEG